MIENLIYALIGSGVGALSVYAIAKKLYDPIKIAEDLIDFIVNDIEMQKRIFLLGSILGNGIKSGVGLNPKSGKFRMEDLIGMALQQFFMRQQQPETQTPEHPLFPRRE